MSVLGLGIDLVDVASFSRQLELAGSTFAEGTFTGIELAGARNGDVPGSPGYARHLAARFAAKEAFVKAWSMSRAGAPPAMPEVRWLDVEVLSDDWGRPSLELSGATATMLGDTLGAVDVAVSLTHEDTMAAAVVVISAPADPAAGRFAVSASAGSSGESTR